MGTSGREVNKAKQTLHLYGTANHHADTDCMSHRIKAGTASETAQANTKLHENVFDVLSVTREKFILYRLPFSKVFFFFFNSRNASAD